MKKLTINTGDLTDAQTSLLMDLFCDVLGGDEMNEMTLKPHSFTLSVEEVGTSKDQKIADIKRILRKCCDDSTSTCELEADGSPCISSTGTNRNNISVLVERFSTDGVGIFTYHNETEISEGDLSYEELEEDIIDEILELLEQKEIEDEKLL